MKQRNPWPPWIVLFAMMAGVACGQNRAPSTIQFSTDYARYRGPSDWTYLEVYLSIPLSELPLRSEGSGYRADFHVDVEILSGDSVAASYARDFTHRIDSTRIHREDRVYEATSFYLREGEYEIRARVHDLYVRTENRSVLPLSITAFPRDSLAMSDVQLAVKMSPDTVQSKFLKNGYRVIPNPRRLYGLEVPTLFYYSEIYNLAPLSAGEDSTYVVRVAVLDGEGREVQAMGPKIRRRLGSSLVEAGSLGIADLFTGTYRLRIDVEDPAAGGKARREVTFYVYKEDVKESPTPDPSILNPMDPEYIDMSEDELDEQFACSEYIATGQEKRRYRRLTLEGKRRFLQQFWKIRDENPLTPPNEFKRDYLERVAYANRQFSSNRTVGWKTEQGRVLLQYGRPNDIERFPSSVNEKAYEAWQYFEIESGVIFYFVDVRNTGEMRLVHSNARNEIYDPDWERWLRAF